MVAQIPLEPQQKSVVLPTAVIRVQGFDGGLLQVRALIDSGSEASLISEVCVKKLGLSRSNRKVTVSGLGQQAAGTTRGLPGQVKDNGGVPVAQNTIFGWIVSGNQAIYSSSLRSNVSIVNLHTELDLNRTLRMFWEQEEVPKPQQLNPSEQAATELFRSTLTRDENGRFIVRLLFDDSKPALGESLTSAIKRLRSMERRFRQDEEFYTLYSEFLSEYLALGHMEEVPPDELEVETSKCFYLPHHAVVKAESTTTKLRVVFDASCASSTGVSLNDRLLAGPRGTQ
ncbi:uncharacterized protein LOC135700674 [Ochlerotatus camptorhynchus]|uniref:uncharacterized protein LOC135700674 n=1 Tax=Ochlerotatus camptorhynchus TaxID=644619 RepID=UPI0031DDCB50